MSRWTRWRKFIAGYREAGGVFVPRGLEEFSMAIAARHNFPAETILAALRCDTWMRDTAEAILA